MTEKHDTQALTIPNASNGSQLPALTLDKAEVKKYICPGATDQELALFMGICNSYQLNPFKREIHFVKYGDKKAQSIVGYEVYLKRAERTGRLDGWDVVISKDGSTATITIHRKDWDNPFVWVVDKNEFDKEQSTWNAMPRFMLKKVAIAQGMRLAFPDELGGMPYIPEELPDNMIGEIQSESLAKGAIETEATEIPEPDPEPTPKQKVKAANENAKKRTESKTEPEAKPKAKPEQPKNDAAASFEEPSGEVLDVDKVTKICEAFLKYDVGKELLVKWRGLEYEEWTESVRKELLNLHKAFRAGDMTKEALEAIVSDD